MDSDDEDDDKQRREKPELRSVNPDVLSELSPNAGTNLSLPGEGKQTSSAGLVIKNKAFTCCIKQYGVKVDENDARLANAGDGKRWERRFGLFGTQIC